MELQAEANLRNAQEQRSWKTKQQAQFNTQLMGNDMQSQVHVTQQYSATSKNMDGVLTAVRGNIANIAGIIEGIQNANARVDRVKERVTDRYRGQSESAPPIVEGSAAISGSGQNDADAVEADEVAAAVAELSTIKEEGEGEAGARADTAAGATTTTADGNTPRR
eukprot:CAMPEP_0170817864 /NCGR_PEP_ID=MMETSP0733-20121128/40312_1 /TAXON_ID=186038 /ORGANISM="Fragilariopsis kerguelensis, Strain L26-C5" /LENGTH=164 /DNA_ID=CAMNT_0011177703 /DNA_START=490 /DNA_END=988 /DNA_ORIENTATION=-